LGHVLAFLGLRNIFSLFFQYGQIQIKGIFTSEFKSKVSLQNLMFERLAQSSIAIKAFWGYIKRQKEYLRSCKLFFNKLILAQNN